MGIGALYFDLTNVDGISSTIPIASTNFIRAIAGFLLANRASMVATLASFRGPTALLARQLSASIKDAPHHTDETVLKAGLGSICSSAVSLHSLLLSLLLGRRIIGVVLLLPCSLTWRSRWWSPWCLWSSLFAA